jgi:L-iditol 2-dehydrogenase
MNTMKAAVLHAPNDLRVEQVPMPVAGPGEALVRVTACGVCGSDVPRVRTNGTYRFPTIPGHEMAGVVESIVPSPGLAVPVRVGDAVSIVPLVPCGSCRFCEIGQFAQCERYDFLGSRSDGGFAQYLKAPVGNLVPLPTGVSGEAGALLEPVTVALHALRNLGVSWGETVAVLGMGAIGNFVAQWARVFGASRVFGIDVTEAKVAIARDVGLLDSFYAAGIDVPGTLNDLTGGAGVDVVFDASGSPAAFNQAIAGLRTFGRLGLLGRPGAGVSIDGQSYEKILRCQLTIRGTWSFELAAFPHHPWTEAAAALASGAIRSGPLVTHRVTLEEVPKAIEMMASGTQFYHKVLVLP